MRLANDWIDRHTDTRQMHYAYRNTSTTRIRNLQAKTDKKWSGLECVDESAPREGESLWWNGFVQRLFLCQNQSTMN